MFDPSPAALDAARKVLGELADEHDRESGKHSDADQGWCPVCLPAALRAAYVVDRPAILEEYDRSQSIP